LLNQGQLQSNCHKVIVTAGNIYMHDSKGSPTALQGEPFLHIGLIVFLSFA